jgi:hypothetical protein
MKRLLLFTLTLAGIASADCVCGGVSFPEDWYSVYEGGGCTTGQGGCGSSTPIFVVTSWACYNWLTSERIDCQIDYCNGICDTGATAVARMAEYAKRHPDAILRCPRKPIQRPVPVDRQLALMVWEALWR